MINTDLTFSQRRQIYEAIEFEASYEPRSVDIRKVAEGSGFSLDQVVHVISRIGYHWIDKWRVDTKVINV